MKQVQEIIKDFKREFYLSYVKATQELQGHNLCIKNIEIDFNDHSIMTASGRVNIYSNSRFEPCLELIQMKESDYEEKSEQTLNEVKE